jgi:hypothetical protein
VTPCSSVALYQRFARSYCVHVQGSVRIWTCDYDKPKIPEHFSRLHSYFYVHTLYSYCLLYIICTNKCTYLFIYLLLQSALQPLVGFRPAHLSLSILSRKVLQSVVASGTSNPPTLRIYIYYNIKLYYKRPYTFRCFCAIFREIWYCVC